MKRGFSASTVVLVALLLSVLFMVGKYVNPPVKGGHDDHDEKSEKTSAPTPTTNGKMASNSNGKMPPTSGGGMPPNSGGGMPDTSGGRPSVATEDKMKKEMMGRLPPEQARKVSQKPKPDEMDAGYFQRHTMGPVETKPETKP